MIATIAQLGGVFALLVFCHFVVDWLFQSHDEAMRKTQEWRVRARHCFIYAVGFVPPLVLMKLTLVEFVISMLMLFVSHFYEDTYYPVFLWVKFVRRPPEFKTSVNDRDAFITWFGTPLGKIIGIVVDQLIHIAFLIPIAWFVVN